MNALTDILPARPAVAPPAAHRLSMEAPARFGLLLGPALLLLYWAVLHEDLARGDPEADAAQHMVVPEGLVHVGQFNAHFSLPVSTRRPR